MTLRTKAVIKLILTMLLVALVTVLAKQSLAEISFFTFLWLQMACASIAMLLYTFVIKREPWPKQISAKSWWLVIGIGILNFALVRAIFIYTLDLLPVTTHAYIMNFVGIVTMFLSAFLLSERPRILQIVGALIAILGLWVYFYQVPSGGELKGVLWLSFGVVCLALTNIFIRQLHLLKGSKISSNLIATIAINVGSLPIIIWGLIEDDSVVEVTLVHWSVIVVNGLIAIAFAMVIFSQVMRHLKAFEASIIATSGVIFTAIFAMPILNDYLDIFEICGVTLMLIGIALVQWQRMQQQP